MSVISIFTGAVYIILSYKFVIWPKEVRSTEFIKKKIASILLDCGLYENITHHFFFLGIHLHSFSSKVSSIFAIVSYITCTSFPIPFLWLFYQRWKNWYLFIWSCALGLKEFTIVLFMHRILIEVLRRRSMRFSIFSEGLLILR